MGDDWFGFANKSTKVKLIYSFGSLFLCIGIMVYSAWSTFNALNPAKEGGPAGRALTIAKAETEIDNMQLAVLAALQPGQADVAAAEISNQSNRVSGDLEKLVSDAAVASISKSFDEFKTDINSSLIPMVKSNRLDEARAFVSGREQEQFRLLREHCQAEVDRQHEESGSTMENSKSLFIIVSVVALFLAIYFSYMLNAVIAEPLLSITSASEKLAVGDFQVVLPNPDRKDEVGALIKAFLEMIESLESISMAAQKVAQGDLTVQVKPRSENDSLGSAFKSMVENMSDATGQFKRAVMVLSEAVNNIMASVAESATGATQTATAVTETTTTVEQVRQTSHVANQKAKNVAESAQKSAQISTMGRKSTEETIQGMKRIREQMDLIADSMVRLSEKSQSIVEIIATVDDLAQQSNLLAVNASIEAAKAGELGRGFAVVAQEVKSMADQSKQATAQVRKILTEIQQATSSAAMATELGSRAVDSAVTQSNQAGEAITVLSNSVIESANAAAQIAVSSQQQLAGVDQVATAMLGIKEATAQNLVAIRNVEESAQSLNELGGMLKVIVQRYQL